MTYFRLKELWDCWRQDPDFVSSISCVDSETKFWSAFQSSSRTMLNLVVHKLINISLIWTCFPVPLTVHMWTPFSPFVAYTDLSPRGYVYVDYQHRLPSQSCPPLYLTLTGPDHISGWLNAWNLCRHRGCPFLQKTNMSRVKYSDAKNVQQQVLSFVRSWAGATVVAFSC